MIAVITDTHAVIWYLFSDPRLGSAASAFIDDTISKGNHIGVSAISFAEMVYLIEKSRIPPIALNDLRTAIADPKAVLKHVPLDEDVAMTIQRIPRQDVPDLPDRVIAATAQLHGISVLSRDRRIRSSSIETIW